MDRNSSKYRYQTTLTKSPEKIGKPGQAFFHASILPVHCRQVLTFSPIIEAWWTFFLVRLNKHHTHATFRFEKFNLKLLFIVHNLTYKDMCINDLYLLISEYKLHMISYSLSIYLQVSLGLHVRKCRIKKNHSREPVDKKGSRV